MFFTFALSDPSKVMSEIPWPTSERYLGEKLWPVTFTGR